MVYIILNGRSMEAQTLTSYTGVYMFRFMYVATLSYLILRYNTKNGMNRSPNS